MTLHAAVKQPLRRILACKTLACACTKLFIHALYSMNEKVLSSARNRL